MTATGYRFGAFILVPSTRELWHQGRAVPLPRRVFDCLLYLLERRERAVGRDELVATLWSRVDVPDTQLSQLMRRVRRAIGDDGHAQEVIRTVPGFGYRWAMPVESHPLPEAAETAVTADAMVPSAATQHSSASPDVTVTERTGRTQISRIRTGLMITAVLMLVAAGTLLATHFRAARMPPAQSTAATAAGFVVLPLDIEAPRESGWVRLGAMDVIAERLRSSGLTVPPSESVLAALQASAAASIQAKLEDARSTLGAHGIVQGSAVKSPRGWRIELATTDSGGMARRVTAEQADPLEAARLAADQLLAALGRAEVPADSETESLGESVGRARAAILANELDAARKILLDAPARPDDAPQIKYWLAKVDLLSGKLDQAGAAFTALLGQPATSNDALLHGRSLIGRGGVHIRLAEYAEAEADFDAATAVLRARPGSSALGEALAGRGIALTALHRFEPAIADLGQARAQLERVGDRFDIARVDANLGLLEMVRDRPEQALPYLRSAIERFESFGAVNQLLSSLNALFDAQAYLLQWSDAMATSERRLALRDKTQDPMQRYLMGVDRSRVLTAFGRYREAESALAEVEDAYPDMRPQVAAALHAQRAELAWHRHKPEQALAAARRALDAWPDRRDDDRRARVALTYQRALIASGGATSTKTAPALEVTTDAAVERMPSLFLTLASAEWAALRGNASQAEAYFRDALHAAEVQGLPKHIALVSEAYAGWLLQQDRLEQAGAVAGRVAPWAERDFDCAMLQVALMHAYGQAEPWAAALRRAQLLAGERRISDALLTMPN